MSNLFNDVTDRKLRKLPVVPRLPNWRGTGKAVPRGLRGSEIVRFGTIEGAELEGGGLVIDYRSKGSAAVRRIAFSFNELGMWVTFHRSINETNRSVIPR
jgi:hypothetical protein